MRLLHIVLLVMLIPLTLHAAFEASYDPAPVLFFEPSTGYLPASKLVAKLGTLSISSGGEALFHPSLLGISISHEFLFTGLVSPESGGSGYQTTTSLFYLYAVSTTKKGTETKKVTYSNGYSDL